VIVKPFTEWLRAAPAAWAARQAMAQEDESFMTVSAVDTGVKRGYVVRGKKEHLGLSVKFIAF
jgi:hypothetical protein